MLFKPVVLSQFTVPGNLFLAPIAGYSDAAFRSICLEHGAGLAFTEMVSVEALARGNRETLKLLYRAESEPRLCVQLFTASARSVREAVRLILPYRPALIDLNCGCSIPKILRAGCGAVLLQHPEIIRDIVAAVRDEAGLPVSVKIRSGWDADDLNYLEVAEFAVRGGASMITLHPRTRAQGFTGRAELEHLRILKASVQIPVIGSGDLFEPEDARAMLERTGCDGVMFARGALGNPFIFQETQALLQGLPLPAPADPRRKLFTALKHLERSVARYGEAAACLQMRKNFCAYTRGIPQAAELRARLVRSATLDEYRLHVETYLKQQEELVRPV